MDPEHVYDTGQTWNASFTTKGGNMTKGQKRQTQQEERTERIPPRDMEKVRANAWAELVRYLAQRETGQVA